MPTTVLPFEPEHVEAAAQLLARRHTEHRRSEPLLDPVYETPAACAVAITEMLASADASGAIAFDGAVATAFVLGHTKEPSWGPHIWIEAGGYAGDDPETLRDTYAAAAQRWYDEGRTSHFVLTAAHRPEVVDAWFRLGFGQMHAHAIRESAPLVPTVTGAVLRPPTAADIDQIVELEFVLPQHQGRSPVFSAGPAFTPEEVRADWIEDIDDPKYHHLVIDQDGVLVALATGCAATVSSMHSGVAGSPQSGFLGHAAVRPEARGRGYGRALGEAVIAWSHEQGFAGVVNDWRVTNLLASRSWPRMGWRTTFLRLHRTIGPAG